MAYATDKKPGELTALTTLATDDVFVVGDTSDVSEVAKVITKANLITDLGATFEPLKGADDNYVTDAEKAALHAYQTSIVGITGTKAQFDTAVTDGNFLYVGDVTSNATHTGDVTGATALTIANSAVTLAKMANLAQDQFIGRVTASTGVPETATITAAARTVLDDTTVAAMVNTLGGATSTGTGGIVRAAGSTLTGTTTVDRLDYDRAVGGVNAIGNLGATETIDWSTHTHYTGTLDSNITFTYSNQVSGQTITLYLSYDGSAARTISWPTTTWMDNATGAAPTAPAASGNVMVVTLVYVGSVTYGSATGNYAVY